MDARKADAPDMEASRPVSKQLGLWSNYSMGKIVIKTGAICTECKEDRDKKVVAYLQDMGWDVVYGGKGRGSIVPDDKKFTKDFYEAISRSQYA